jgi:hypothetical protein
MDRLADCLPPESCPEVFADLPVVFDAAWQDYEECGWVVVFKFFDELMVCEGGYSVMAESNEFRFEPHGITEEDLTRIQEEWAGVLVAE